MKQRRWVMGTVAASVLLAACSGSALDSGGDSSGDPSAAAGDGDATGEGDGASGEGGDADRGTITVGLINPLTGPFAALGEDTNAGFQLYLDQNDGVLSGYEVEVLVEDEANDTAIATEGVERMLGQGAEMLVGFVNSGVAYGASTVIRESGVPLMVTTAGADDLTQRDAEDDDNIFRLSYTSSQDSMPLGDYACNELGYETVAIVGLDYAFGWEAAGGFAKAYEDAGCEVVQELYAPLGTQDWAPFVQQIDRSADAVWGVIAGSDAIRFTRSYSDFGVGLPLIGHGSTTDEQVLEEQAEFAEGIVTTLHYAGAYDSPLNTEFREAFEEAAGASVSQYAEHGYATAQVLEAALADLDSFDSASLGEAIGAVEIEAPRGPLSFDEYGQAVYNVYVREVVQDADGRWVNEVIEEYPETTQFWDYDPEDFMSGQPLAELRNSWAS